MTEEKIQKIKDAYKSRIAPYKDLDKMDYRDIFEFLFVGNKFSTFFLANTIFFLKNTPWSLDYNKFMDEYTSTINQKNILIKKDEKDSPFITSVLDFFKFESNLEYLNVSSSKGSNKQNNDEDNSDVFDNAYTYKETYSHYKFTK